MHDILTSRSPAKSERVVKTSWFRLKSPALRAEVEVSRFAPAGGTAEVHFMIQATRGGTPADQHTDREREREDRRHDDPVDCVQSYHLPLIAVTP